MLIGISVPWSSSGTIVAAALLDEGVALVLATARVGAAVDLASIVFRVEP